ncbi:hypothetical protein DPMN_159589, partial [Dreissena polymorpha]
MARQRPTRLVMRPCIVEIDRIVIREVQYQLTTIDNLATGQLEVNRCRNEEIIVKGNFGRAWPMWAAGRPRIDCIVIREVQYHFEVNQLKWNFGWAWPMWTGRPRINRIVIREVQYQFEVTRCRNEEIIVKGNCGWAWPMWAGRPRVGNGAMHIHRCRNEEIIAKGNFGWAWPMRVGRPRIDRIVIREVQYQFEDNQYRNEEIIFQGSMARTDGQTDGQTNRHTAEITTISPRFSKS